MGALQKDARFDFEHVCRMRGLKTNLGPLYTFNQALKIQIESVALRLLSNVLHGLAELKSKVSEL